MQRNGSRAVVLALAVVASGGCSSPDLRQGSAEGGVQVRPVGQTHSLEPILAVRALDDSIPLGEIGPMLVLPDGRLWVVDVKAPAGLVLYSLKPDGSLERILARDGAGPGEISRSIRLAGLPDGVVAVADYSNARLVRFSQAGDYLGEFQLPAGSPRFGGITPDSSSGIYVS